MKLQEGRTPKGTYYKIVLPKAIVLAKGWKKGQELRVELDNKGNLIIKEK